MRKRCRLYYVLGGTNKREGGPLCWLHNVDPGPGECRIPVYKESG